MFQDPKTVRRVHHYQVTGWAEKGIPTNAQCVLDLINMVECSQRKSNNAPVVVQCRLVTFPYTTQVNSFRALSWATETRDNIRWSPPSEAAIASRGFLPICRETRLAIVYTEIIQPSVGERWWGRKRSNNLRS